MDPDQEQIENADEQDVDLDEEESEETDSDSNTSDSNSDENGDSDESEENNLCEMNGSQNKLNDDEYQAKLIELETSINQNQLQYQSYVDIIQLCRSNSDMNKLKEYREKMSQIYPLTENLWMEWLKDEQKLMMNAEDRQRVKELFEKAVQDYLSVEIWLEFIHFSIGGMGETNGIENVRSVCERAISLAGLHVTKGHILWEAYREFESAILSGYQQTYAGTVQSAEQTRQTNEQINRIIKLFKLELTVCLEKCAASFNEFKEFDENQITDQIQKVYAKSIENLKEIEPFEIALKNPEIDSAKKLSEYKKYLDFELKKIAELEKNKIKQNNKSNNEASEEASQALNYHRRRLKCLFERSLSDDSNCLDVSLWLKYIHYLNEEEGFVETNQTQREFNLSVAKRSVRNCPWSSQLWINYALLLERTSSPVDSVKALFNGAMNGGLESSNDYLQLWHAYLDFLKRLYVKNKESKPNQAELIEELREYFQKAINQQFDYFKNQGDPTFSLEKYWAYVEAKYFKCMDQCRKIYNEMILAKSDQSKYSSVWIEFYDLEKEFGDEKHQRKLLNRALNEVASAEEKEIIYEILIKFEKLNGNVQQYSCVYFKYEQFKHDQSVAKQAVLASKKKTDTSNKKDLVKFKQNPAKTNNDFSNGLKNKPIGQIKSEQPKQENGNNLKRKKSDPDSGDLVQSESKKQLKDKDGFAIPSLPVLAPVTASNKSITTKSSATINASAGTDQSIENYKKFSNLTVFISNLSYEADENKIRTVFEKEPGFKEMRILKNWSGKSKGYGYVDFETNEQATNALKLDRTPIDGRPMFVSRNQDKSTDVPQNKLKYAASLEKNKLFVSGLPFTTESKDLEEIFKNFGKLKEVRIVTYKNGKSKGLAYVEFEEEQSAAKALLQTDRMLIGDFEISVAISNPPKRKQTDNSESGSTQISSSLGSGSFKTGTPATSSTSNAATAFTSFMPRSQMIGRKARIDFKK